MDQDKWYVMKKEEEESSGNVSEDLKDYLRSVLKKLISEIELLIGKVENLPPDKLALAARVTSEALEKFRSLEKRVLNQHSDEVLVKPTDLEDLGHDQKLPGNNKPAELIADYGKSSK